MHPVHIATCEDCDGRIATPYVPLWVWWIERHVTATGHVIQYPRLERPQP